MTTQPTQVEKPGAPAEADAMEITRHWNRRYSRYRCRLCGGLTEKQDEHYCIDLGDLGLVIICDGCGEYPEQIPNRIRLYAASLREHAAEVDGQAQHRFVRSPSGDDPIPPSGDHPEHEVANLKAILDSDIGKLMKEDPHLSYGPAVLKAGRSFRPEVEQWLKENAMRVGEWGKGKEDRQVGLYWVTYPQLMQRLSELEECAARE